MKFLFPRISNRGEESPSPRRAWIEMLLQSLGGDTAKASPSPRRAWIEINYYRLESVVPIVALPTEGVD